MESHYDGSLSFLNSWSDDLDPAARHARPSGNAVIDLEGVYLPEADAPAATVRLNGVARTFAFASLSAAAWLFLPPK